MGTKSDANFNFPVYLPKPDEEVLKWVGNYLKNSRGKKTVAAVATAAKVEPNLIENLENGIIHCDLGMFRQIINRGYKKKMEGLLSECYETFFQKFNPQKKRSFDRDFCYAICRDSTRNKGPTSFLVGGDPESFLWAVPFRKLKKQPLSVDLLELAPIRVKSKHGETPYGRHEGIEVIQVIIGKITISVDIEAEDPSDRILKAGDAYHLNSTQEHQIKNNGGSTSALLQIIRFQ